jgi:hypothetical protein
MDNQMENQVIEQLQNQIQHLLNQVQDLSMHVAAQPQSLSFGKSLRKPPEYDGKDRKACATFLSHLNLYISGNPTLFPNDAAKVTFAASYLRDRAFSWFEPYLLDKKAPIRYDFDLFTKELLKNLGDPDRIRTLTRDLQTLTQSGSASDYTARFYQISSYLSWNDNALRDQYYTGLKPAVKDALAYSNSDPDTLKELSDLAIRLDNRLFERRIETRKTNDKREHRTGTSTPRYNQSSNSTSAARDLFQWTSTLRNTTSHSNHSHLKSVSVAWITTSAYTAVKLVTEFPSALNATNPDPHNSEQQSTLNPMSTFCPGNG